MRIIGYVEYWRLYLLSQTTTRNVNFKEVREGLKMLLDIEQRSA
jgi:hypothetical protein